MSFLLVATFKSNKTVAEVKTWVDAVAPVAKSSPAEIVVAPSFPHLHLVINHQPLAMCSQDVSPFPAGSYTGAVSAVALADLGVRYCLVGHSERRRYFKETQMDVANKVSELLGAGITPILCLAEADIFPQLAALPDGHKSHVIYCYEPPADIGGTATAPVSDIARVFDLIRSSLGSPRLMYGGSVNAGNLIPLLPLNLDGVLVSTASLEPESFASVITTFNESQGK